jgi:hypothetical protein
MSTNEGKVINDAPEYDSAGASAGRCQGESVDFVVVDEYCNDHYADWLAFVWVVIAPLAIIAGCCLLTALISIWLCDGCGFTFCLGGLW